MMSENSLRRFLAATLTACALALAGCNGNTNVNTEINLSPRGQAVITLDPDSRNKIELRNRGPGIVLASGLDAENRMDTEVTIGPAMHYSDSWRGISSITLRNLSGYRTKVGFDLKHAKSYELSLREAEAGAHAYE